MHAGTMCGDAQERRCTLWTANHLIASGALGEQPFWLSACLQSSHPCFGTCWGGEGALTTCQTPPEASDPGNPSKISRFFLEGILNLEQCHFTFAFVLRVDPTVCPKMVDEVEGLAGPTVGWD